MKTKSFTQNQLVAHTENEDNFAADKKPKNLIIEDLNAEPVHIKDSYADSNSSPFDLFENVTAGSNSIQDRNRGVTNINLPHPGSSPKTKK